MYFQTLSNGRIKTVSSIRISNKNDFLLDTESGLYSADFGIGEKIPIAKKHFDVEIENSPLVNDLVLETMPKLEHINIGDSVKARVE